MAVRELGIMLYGYGREDAETIKDTLERVLSAELEMISASGQEDTPVMEVLNAGPSDVYEDGERKVLMVLGFTEDDLERTLRGFPRTEGMVRPIFCVLTDHNASWPLRELVDDLVREREHIERTMAARRERDDG